MAISVKRLSGEDIPAHLRAEDPSLEVVFQIEDAHGQLHHRRDDREAAALAVAFSEQHRTKGGQP